MPSDAPARAGPTTRPRSVGKWMLALLLLQLQMAGTIRIGYRLPQSAGRSAGGTDVGSGRDLFKKFLLFRGLFPQEPTRENIIVIPQASSTFTTPTTTTTTTTSIVNGTSTRRWRNLEYVKEQPVTTQSTAQMPDEVGLQQRITRRRKPNTKTSNNNQQRRHKKKRRHRHIHKRQRRHQQRR
ncbi:uncharacterized protein LOC111601624 [Drosophila hydei]|uniref:Uncharacterized protein LOC111601624 n=1 Tax=Drosophila hydei TaxID=7224 RepID=A0A6J1M6Q5_DROHY|nr:uncharacterized protein LOC111601624 [Drosophila hydei]